MEFQGKVAVITGAASGIGRETALILGQRGATVVLADIQEEAGQKTLRELQSQNIRAEFITNDVTRLDQIHALFATAIAHYAQVDILVNCAGIARRTPVPEITPEEWDLVFSINLKSAFFCSQAALNHMCARQYGKIVSIASASGKSGGVAVGAHYSASKAGIICMTKSLALYAAPYRINVNSVCPGPIATPMTEVWGDAVNTAFAEMVPFKRYGTPGEVAEAIAFLASDRSQYITGETLDVNGGLIMD
ncbi:MAG: SDR family oxidoreductase [Desulfobacterales bacterium]|nr:MAG: SDR family oxidoreductase [Desulfobacterales bacterium]